MGKKILILLSHKYPYEPPVEVFLNRELTFSAEQFDQVYSFNTAGAIDKKIHYPIIHNIEYFTLHDYSKSLHSISGFLFALKSVTRYMMQEINAKRRNSKAIIAIFNTYAWAVMRFGQAINVISKLDLNSDDQIVIYSYWLGSYTVLGIIVGYWLRKYKKCSAVKCITRAHGQGDLYPVNGLNFHPGFSIINKCVQNIYTVSDAGREYLKLEFVKPKIETFRLGVKGPDKYITSVHKDDFLIVSCSTVNDNKRVGLIVDILSGISNTKIKWVHFGDGPLFEAVKRAAEQRLKGRVEFEFMGNTKNSDVIEYYKEHTPDLFINVSMVEGLPVSVMEAFAYSIPVIATNTGAANEIISNGSNGLLIPIRFDIQDVQKQLSDFLALPLEKRNSVRRKAFDAWKASYNETKNYQSYSIEIGKS